MPRRPTTSEARAWRALAEYHEEHGLYTGLCASLRALHSHQVITYTLWMRMLRRIQAELQLIHGSRYVEYAYLYPGYEMTHKEKRDARVLGCLMLSHEAADRARREARAKNLRVARVTWRDGIVMEYRNNNGVLEARKPGASDWSQAQHTVETIRAIADVVERPVAA